MLINIVISILLFKKYGFVIIPIATSIATWVAVLIYFYLLNNKKIINFEKKTLINLLKISFSVTLMCFFLYFSLDYFEDKFEYAYNFKLIYLLIVVGLSAGVYLITASRLGVLNLRAII